MSEKIEVGEGSNKMEIDASELDNYVCEECGNDTFVTAFFVKRISKDITKAEKPKIYPYLETLACSKCGHVNQKLRPTE